MPEFTDGEIESERGKKSEGKLLKSRALALCLAHTTSHKDGLLLKRRASSFFKPTGDTASVS